MKILMVNKFLFPNGGSETYMLETGRELERQGHEVQYFGMEHPDRIVGNRVESYTSNMDFHTGKLKRLLYPFQIIYSQAARRAIRAVLEDFRPDVVHLNNFNFQLTPSILYEIKKCEKRFKKRIKILYTAHDTQFVCPNHLMRIPATGEMCRKCIEKGFVECVKNSCIHNSRVKSLCAFLEAELYKALRTYRYIDCIICPSGFMEKQLLTRKELEGKTRVLYNFVPALEKQRKEDAKEGEYVLYFGRFSEEKGLETLLRVCSKLSHIPFVFAGSGPMEQKISEIPNIKNKGFQKGSELYELIRKAKFSIISSECYENCPFSVMESLSCGTPVIGSRIGGIPELIEDGKTGELFEPGDGNVLLEKINSLWDDYDRLQAYCKECCKTDFDTVESYCSKLIHLIEEL